MKFALYCQSSTGPIRAVSARVEVVTRKAWLSSPDRIGTNVARCRPRRADPRATCRRRGSPSAAFPDPGIAAGNAPSCVPLGTPPGHRSGPRLEETPSSATPSVGLPRSMSGQVPDLHRCGRTSTSVMWRTIRAGSPVIGWSYVLAMSPSSFARRFQPTSWTRRSKSSSQWSARGRTFCDHRGRRGGQFDTSQYWMVTSTSDLPS